MSIEAQLLVRFLLRMNIRVLTFPSATISDPDRKAQICVWRSKGRVKKEMGSIAVELLSILALYMMSSNRRRWKA